MSQDYYREVKSIRISKVSGSNRERGIRLYCEQAGRSWNLQIRAPLGIGNFGLRDGKDFVIANASLDATTLVELRDAINQALTLDLTSARS